MPCIEFKDVSKSLSGNVILNSVSFSVHEGETVALFGIPESSAAQVITIASGISSPDQGTVRVMGTLPRESQRGGMTYSLLGSERFPSYLTPMNFISLCSRHYNFDRATAKQVLRYTGLWNSRNLKFDLLSDPEKQQLCIAPLLCASPAVVLMDSFFPLNGMQAKELFGEAFSKLSSAKTTFLISSDSFANVRNIASRVILLKGGSVVYDVRMRDLMSGEGKSETRVRVSDVVAAAAAVPGARVERDCLVLGEGKARLGPVITLLEESGISVLSVEKGSSLLGLIPGVSER
jgi:ABC-2 type transport system ATP-binding protein